MQCYSRDSSVESLSPVANLSEPTEKMSIISKLEWLGTFTEI